MNRILNPIFFILKNDTIAHQKGAPFFHIQLKGYMLSGTLGAGTKGVRVIFVGQKGSLGQKGSE